MKNKIKKFFQNKILLLILGVFIGGTTCVYAVTYFPSNQVTYNNTSSKLNSTDVQGAIDELYNTCKSAASGSNNFKALTIAGYVYFSTNDGIYRIAQNGNGGVKKITSYAANALTSTGSYIYFSTNDGIYRIAQNGNGGVKKITSYAANALTSIDSYIYFSTNDGIYSMTFDGRAINRIY